MIQKPDTPLRHYLSVMFELLYPSLCEICKREYIAAHNLFCIKCFSRLPFVNFNESRPESFRRYLDSDIPIEGFSSMLVFNPGSPVSELIHRFKYKNRPELGFELGKFFGEILFHEQGHENVDYIIPVPLHPKKIRQRGFNQSDFIASGLSKAMKIPVNKTLLKRVLHTDTQTRMNKIQRMKNIQNAFELQVEQKKAYKNQHFLLVDDVLTTGSTLIACAKQLLIIEGAKVSMFTLATGS